MNLVNGVHFLAKMVDLDASGIKDLSFENPKGPFPFANKEDRPAISECYLN